MTTPIAPTAPTAPTAIVALDNQFSDADGFYEALLDAHQDLDKTQSDAFNARLILVLANQIGDLQMLRACIHAAR